MKRISIIFLLLATAFLSAQQTPTQTVAGMKAAPGLEVSLWASEPQFSNPTNMAIDERGRIWVLEAVNYRRFLRNQPDLRAAGDRIVILEDKTAMASATTSRCSIRTSTSAHLSASRCLVTK